MWIKYDSRSAGCNTNSYCFRCPAGEEFPTWPDERRTQGILLPQQLSESRHYWNLHSQYTDTCMYAHTDTHTCIHVCTQWHTHTCYPPPHGKKSTLKNKIKSMDLLVKISLSDISQYLLSWRHRFKHDRGEGRSLLSAVVWNGSSAVFSSHLAFFFSFFT